MSNTTPFQADGLQPLAVTPAMPAISFDIASFEESPSVLANEAPSHVSPPYSATVGELTPDALLPEMPKMTWAEAFSGPADDSLGPVTGPRASAQRIIAAFVSITVVLMVLAAVGYGVYSFLETLDSTGETQTQDLFMVGVWGVLALIAGKPRLTAPGKRSRRSDSMATTYWVFILPAGGIALTLAGFATATSLTTVSTLIVGVVGLAVCAWRTWQSVSAVKARSAGFTD